MALLSLFVQRRRPDIGYTPQLTVLISAYNEEATIGEKIGQTLSLEYPHDKLEVLVVSDGSSDQTDEIVKSCPDPRVQLLRIEERLGKTHAQNEGVKLSTGEIIVFSDATATYHSKALLYLAAPYADPRVGAVSGRYRYFDPTEASVSPTGFGSIVFWDYEHTIKLLQSRIGYLTGCSGCIYSVRHRNYVSLPPDSCSDLVEPLYIIRNGYRVDYEDRALAYEETTRSLLQEFEMRVRVAARGMRGVLSVPELLLPWRHPWTAFQLTSHKMGRWIAPFLLILLFVGSAFDRGSPFLNTLFCLQVLFYCLGFVCLVLPLHRYCKPLGLPLFFCTVNAAVLVALLEVLRGRKFTIWETVRQRAQAKL
ncbi:MAG: glycosyltransferase family 2 protein [Bryobacteraceae bacterium]